MVKLLDWFGRLGDLFFAVQFCSRSEQIQAYGWILGDAFMRLMSDGNVSIMGLTWFIRDNFLEDMYSSDVATLVDSAGYKVRFTAGVEVN